ncbi:MAG: insulinase family protein [Candidatus Riflebacteria bacterium]|nr:insulinase family protein [Candidatus Riflebacteria bacterium]
MDKPYYTHRFDNGISLIAERIPTVQTVSLGLFLHTGVIYEPPKLNGISHFIEHMLFKGTHKRSAKKIAQEFSNVGGVLNAFTAKDFCSYFGIVVKNKLKMAIDVLSDMYLNSLFAEHEIEKERKVILEEIKMYSDSPEEQIHEFLGQSVWHGSKLAEPVLGNSDSVSAITRDDIMRVYNEQYVGGNLLIAAAGNFDFEVLKSLIEEKFSAVPLGTLNRVKHRVRPKNDVNIYINNMEQVHVALGAEGVSYKNPKRYAMLYLSTVLGGGMSSRLFQEIREKRGMAYNVYSYHSSFADTGMFAIYAGTSVENINSILSICREEIEKIAVKGISKSELKSTFDKFKGNLLIGLESTNHRMNRLASGFLYGIEPVTPEAMLKPYKKVTVEDIKSLAAEILKPDKFALTVVSPHKVTRSHLKGTMFDSSQINSHSIKSVN